MFDETRGLNTIKSHGKPPFSYGFPMAFLWISYGFPKKNSDFRRVRPAAFVVADALPETQHGILQLVNSEPARPTNIVTQGAKT